MNAIFLCALVALPTQLEAPPQGSQLVVAVHGARLSAGWTGGSDRGLQPSLALGYDLLGQTLHADLGGTWRIFGDESALLLTAQAGPVLGLSPAELGVAGRTSLLAQIQLGPVFGYAGPKLDAAISMVDRGRVRVMATGGLGVHVVGVDVLALADLGYTYAARDTGALYASVGLALRVPWETLMPPL